MSLSSGQSGQIFKLPAEISDCPQVIYSYDPACTHNFLKTLVKQQVEACVIKIANPESHFTYKSLNAFK